MSDKLWREFQGCSKCKYGNERPCKHACLSVCTETCLSYVGAEAEEAETVEFYDVTAGTKVVVNKEALGKFTMDDIPVNCGVNHAEPGTDKTVVWMEHGDEYLDDLVPASANPKDDHTCLNCKHVLYGAVTSPRCRKFISAINSQYALCTQVRFRTKYCGGKMFERSE